MTVEDALGYIDSVLAQVPGTREQHIRIQAALMVIAQAANPPAPETKPAKPEAADSEG